MKNTKRLLALVLAFVMVLGMTACGAKTPAEDKPQGVDLSGETAESLINKIYETKMPEFALMTMPVDLADAEATTKRSESARNKRISLISVV